MKLTRERTIYVTILGVGLSALALDQVVFSGGPAQAAGDLPTAENEYAVPHSAAALKGSASEGNPETVCVAEQLRRYKRTHDADVMGIRDVFLPPENLDKSAKATEAAAPSSPNRVELFQKVHKLNGVMVADRQGKAIIDGRILLVGQSLDGFKLVKVTQQVAIFESDAGQVVLKIPEKAVGSGSL